MTEVYGQVHDFRVSSAEYSNNGLNKEIDIKVCTLYDQGNLRNVGTILENYRNSYKCDSNFFANNKMILDNLITNCTVSFYDFHPDCIICIYPSDVNRKQLLKSFRDKVTSGYSYREDIDYSSMFVKNDPSKSIKKDMLKLKKLFM